MEEQKHLQYAGHLLVLSIWIQNVMTDLVILKKYPTTLEYFNDLENFKIEDENEFYLHRIEYWKKGFAAIKREFLALFPNLTSYQDRFDFTEHFRDLLAHGHYSLKHDKVIFQPETSGGRFKAKMKTFLGKDFDPTEKSVLKVEMSEQNYADIFHYLMIFEREIFPLAALELEVNLNRLK